jgi:hypothetical protein
MKEKCLVCKKGVTGNRYVYYIGDEELIMHCRCGQRLFNTMKKQRINENECKKIEKRLNVR